MPHSNHILPENGVDIELIDYKIYYFLKISSFLDFPMVFKPYSNFVDCWNNTQKNSNGKIIIV